MLQRPTNDSSAGRVGSYACRMASIEGLLSPAHRRLSIAIYTTVALVAFEGTSVGAALPELASDLGDVGLLPWIITGFLFTGGLSGVIAGPLVDAYGSARLFAPSALVFAGTGFIAGLSNDLVVMIVIRLVQGAASGVLFASVIAAVNLGFPDALTGRAFAANSTVWGVMGAAAPAIAAGLLSVASWRWIFFINLPLGLIAVFAGRNVMPQRQDGADDLSIDVRGSVLVACFTLTSILAVDQLGWNSLALGAAAVAAVVLYGIHARRVERPVVSLDHIAVQPYRSLAMVPSLMLGAAFMTSLYVTVYVAAGRGFSNTAAAWSVLFFTIGWTLGANLATSLLRRFAPTKVMSVGLGTGIVGLTIEAVSVSSDQPLAFVFAGLLTVGVGIGLTTNASLIDLRAATPSSRIGRASAANQFCRSQGFVMGSAAGGAVLLFVVDRQLGSVEPIRRLLAGDDDDLGPEVAAAVRDGYAALSMLAVGVMSLAIIPMIGLRRHNARTAEATRSPGLHHAEFEAGHVGKT